MRSIVLSTFVVVGLASAVMAQTVSLAPDRTDMRTVTITANAPIFLVPDSSRTPLRVAVMGSRLGLIKAEGDWFNVEFRDPQFGTRVGYVEKKYARENLPDLQPMDLSIRETVNAPTTSSRDESRQRDRPTPATPSRSPGQLNAHRREGFWFSAGLGRGWLGCEDCDGERLGGLSGGLTFGGTLTPRVLLGVGTTGWTKAAFGERLSLGTLDLRLRFYPSTNSGFFITGGLGAGSISFAGESEFGAGAVLGLGMDLRVGSNVSITPFLNGFAMASSNLDANVGQMGLAITVH